MKKKVKQILVVIMFLLSIVGVYGETEAPKIGLIMSTGGLGSGFNKMAYDALIRLKEEGKISDFKYIEPNNVAEDAQYLRDFSNSGEYNLIIGMGTVVAQSLEDVQKGFPNQKYALVGGTTVIEGTKTVDFAEHEVSFLAGALSALVSKNEVVGTIPAMKNKSFDRFVNGFKQGAKYVNPKIKVLNTYIPTTSGNPFNDPVAAKNIALQMNKKGADVIFHIAELSGMGVFEAARENNFYAIGCDEDEDGKLPGVILTSVRVRIDNAVYNVVEELIRGEFKTGYKMANFADTGISLTDFNFTKEKIGEENLKRLEEIKNKIIAREIIVKE